TGDPVEVIRQRAVVARHSEVSLLVCLITSEARMAEVRRAVREDPSLPPVHATPFGTVRTASGMLRAALRPSADDEEPAVREDVDRDAARALVQTRVPSSAEACPHDMTAPPT